MTLGGIVRATLTLAIGAALAGGLFWALVNVPESNVLALALSMLLTLALFIVSGATIALAAATGDGVPVRDALPRVASAMPAFVVGGVLFVILSFITGVIDAWWVGHRGEIDATLIRYANIAHTQGLHATVSWITWTIRWVVGLSIVTALVTTATVRSSGSIAYGLRNGVRLISLIASGIAIAIVMRGLWPAAYWRPAGLAQSMEPVFVAAKLAVLYLAAMVVVAIALLTHGRTARTT